MKKINPKSVEKVLLNLSDVCDRSYKKRRKLPEKIVISESDWFLFETTLPRVLTDFYKDNGYYTDSGKPFLLYRGVKVFKEGNSNNV